MQYACLHIRVLSKALQNIRKSGVAVNSRYYARSFLTMQLWKPAYDNLIVELAVTYGLRLFPQYLRKFKPVKEWILCAFPDSPVSENNEQRLIEFCQQRLRFITYCVVMSLKTRST